MMTRTNIYLTSAQMKRFKAIAKKAGYPLAEIIRRALDEWFEEYEKKLNIAAMASSMTFDEAAELLQKLGEMKKIDLEKKGGEKAKG